MVRVGRLVARAERPCPTCEGRREVTQGHALLLCIQSCAPHLRTLTNCGEPQYLAQARAKNDQRILGFWRRLLALIERTNALRASWQAFDGEELS